MSGAFLTMLRAGPLLADGGMGTSLVERGVGVQACFEALNLEDPELVATVHGSFVHAGARVVTTNTFGANRFKLGERGHGAHVRELNRRGVEIARSVGAWVTGSVGPLGVRIAPLGRVRREEALDAYVEQMSALAEAGVDALQVETQSDLTEIEEAVAAARKVGELPLIVTATFTRDDRTLLGSTPVEVASRLAGLGVDAVGVNCGEGPAQAVRIARQMRAALGSTPLVARPNAGGPEQVGGRFLYPATPEYFGRMAAELSDAGVSLIGGCCGTGPQHIRAMASSIGAEKRIAASVEVVSRADDGVSVASELSVSGERERAPESTALARTLEAGRFAIGVELEPPRAHSAARMIAAAETLHEAGADVIDVTDSPMARLRMSPWAACRLIGEHTGIETVLHFPTRGRNLLRIQGDLLAVHALGIRNVFVCLGDPVTVGDYPGGTDHVDVAPTGLLALVTDGFNRGSDHAGAPIGEPTAFFAGCALNPTTSDLEHECRLLRKKIDCGARFALSQPVYSTAPLRQLREVYEREHGPLEIPILAGVLPLASARHAEFLHNEVPGLVIPEGARERLRRASDRAEAEGIAMAVELVRELSTGSAGIYLMPQFGRYDVAAEIVEAAAAVRGA
jgi:methionine synthase I (cobalamin-dependent)/5,10-methylenetetrahydrofolate reductase